MADHHPTGNIMAVDDQPANLRLLEQMLTSQGHRVRSFPRGRLALTAAGQQPPDLILLDINMPEMDGMEVCRRLKTDARLSRIPVIFLSALNETADKVNAFRSGGADYITKPFQMEEVQARVETHLRVHHLERDLRRHAEHLEEMVETRTRELAEAHSRLRILDQAKSDFLTLISHEFRTPLNGILGIGQLLLDKMSPGGESGTFREMFRQSQERILAILDDGMLLTQIEVEPEKFEPNRLSLGAVVTTATRQTAAFAALRRVSLEAEAAEECFVRGAEALLVKALQSLFETAVRLSGPGEIVRLSSALIPEAVQLTIEGGGNIPSSALPGFFRLFSVGEALTCKGDLGIGAPVASRILSLFGGSVAVENREPAGVRMVVALPRDASDHSGCLSPN